MSRAKRIKRCFTTANSHSRPTVLRKHRLGVEQLEDRQMLAANPIPSLDPPLDNTPPAVNIADQAVAHNNGALHISLPRTDADGDVISYEATLLARDNLAQLAYDLDQAHGLQADTRTVANNYYFNAWGMGEKHLQGSSGAWFTLMGNGDLYRWGDYTPTATLDSEYFSDPSKLHDAMHPSSVAAAADVTVSAAGNTIVVTPRNGFVGFATIEVTAGDGVEFTTDSFMVEVTNAAPVLNSVADQQVGHGAGPVVINLSGSDGNGDSLTYAASLAEPDASADLAYSLDQTHGLRADAHMIAGNYYFNAWGMGEKHLQDDSGNWYLITGNGDLYRSGSAIPLASLGTDYFDNPSLLHDATPPNPTVSAADVTISSNGNTIVVTPRSGFVGVATIEVSAGDGIDTVTRTFTFEVTNNAPIADEIPSVQTNKGSGPITVNLNAVDGDGDSLSFAAAVVESDGLGQLAYDLDQIHGFQASAHAVANNYYFNALGMGEKYLQDRAGNWYMIMGNGDLYRYGSAAPMAALGAAFFENPSMLLEATPPNPSASAADVTISTTGSTVVVTPRSEFVGVITVEVTVGDGIETVTKTFTIDVVSGA